MKKLLAPGLTLLLSATPLIASAQQLGNVHNLVVAVGRIFNLLIPILIVLAILAFFWGLIKYIQGGKGLGEGKNIMLAGIISLFIMISLWGILAFIGNALGINQIGGTLPPPRVEGIL